MTTPSNELKLCPFCGYLKVVIDSLPETSYFQSRCVNCHASGPVSLQEDVQTNWNTRHDSQELTLLRADSVRKDEALKLSLGLLYTLRTFANAFDIPELEWSEATQLLHLHGFATDKIALSPIQQPATEPPPLRTEEGKV